MMVDRGRQAAMMGWRRGICLAIALVLAAVPAVAQPLPYAAMAARIAASLQVSAGERVLLRVDPNTMAALAPLVEASLRARGAVVDTLPYGPARDFEARLARTDVYVWLPASSTATPPDQRAALERWIDNGPGRELHFHWVDGTRDVDGLPAAHTPAYDRVYVDALDVDYRDLSLRMDRAIQRMRAAEVRVTTPAGTDIRFRVGDRPFNKQDGDASAAHARTGRIRIDRHTELPAGILRVAPLEDTVTGVLVIPSARFGGERVVDIRLEFQKGVVTHARARSGDAALQAFLKSDPSASRFREFCLGFNPRLVVPPGETALAYYGYGNGVVRMSLGDNSELGGNVRGGVVRWLFFPDATVRAGSDVLVQADEIRVLSSGGFAAPYLTLVAPFERATGHRLLTGATSTGIGPESIPNRVRRGDPVDVIILPDAALSELIAEGHVAAATRTPLARSGIGVAVRAGAPKPDVSSVEGLRRALLQAKSVAFSAQVSGLYVLNELFPRLGIAAEMKAKSRIIEQERVGAVVARGEAEIGFQQISELLPIPGIEYVGPLPAPVQRVTLFSAGVATKSVNPEAARALIRYLASPAAADAVTKSGMEPVAGPR